VSACSWASCGNCGRCTSRSDGTHWERDPIVACVVCGVVIDRVSIPVLIDRYHSATVCSDLCRQDFEAHGHPNRNRRIKAS
jgi:hypothetical protein